MKSQKHNADEIQKRLEKKDHPRLSGRVMTTASTSCVSTTVESDTTRRWKHSLKEAGHESICNSSRCCDPYP